MSLRSLIQKLVLSLVVSSLALSLAVPAARAEQTPPACTADQLDATSAELETGTGTLAGRIYFSGRRAMPPCSVQGTPKVHVLDDHRSLLPVTQVGVPTPGQQPEPVVIGSPAEPYPATVAIVWRNFCQTPAPAPPYSLRITLPNGGTLPLAPPLIMSSQGYPANAPAPGCEAPGSPSTLAVGPFQVFASSVPHDNRYFSETGYRVDDDTIWDYFTHRGGLNTFGYPISRTFRLQGYRVQFFQRRVVQLDQQGHPRLLNVLDPGLMPYTHFNGATFPGVDPALVASAPSPSDAAATLAFVKAHSPDSYQGVPVRFYRTFIDTISYADAFPGGGDRTLLPGFDLEMWGIPTSPPAVDPNNHDFVYLRFQRGIMHYDASCNCTQGILLADYFKGILTGQGLPADLREEAQGSPLYRQYDPAAPGWVRDPARLPDSDLTNAFTTG